MNPFSANQGRTFLRLLAALLPHARRDRSLPARIQQLIAADKRFGSRDRRLYRELLYTAVRHLPWTEALLARSGDEALRAVIWLAAYLPATRPLKQSLPADWPAAAALTVAEKAAHLATDPAALLPAWFRDHCPAAFASPDLDTLHTRAPLWLRLQTDDPRPVFEEFAFRQWKWQAANIPVGPDLGQAGSKTASIKLEPCATAIQLLGDVDATKTDAYLQGLVEVQDLGSQLLLEAAAPAPGTRWLDACAGAGGKTLQLARLLGPAGHVDAADPRAEALAELRLRATRATLRNIATVGPSPAATALYDGVLVDAPCSGSGTWRRSPHLKWCTTEADIAAAARLQLEILTRCARHVRPGGRLVYATCSLSRRENDDVVAAFLAAQPGFAPAPFAHTFGAAAGPHGLTLSPSLHNTDGYYVANLRRA